MDYKIWIEFLACRNILSWCKMVHESWNEMKTNLHDKICVKGMMQLCSHAENDIDICDHGRKITWNALKCVEMVSLKIEVYYGKTKKVRNYIKS